jgi:hypothetical protein
VSDDDLAISCQVDHLVRCQVVTVGITDRRDPRQRLEQWEGSAVVGRKILVVMANKNLHSPQATRSRAVGVPAVRINRSEVT